VSFVAPLLHLSFGKVLNGAIVSLLVFLESNNENNFNFS
jgi:hypothetical protein